MQFQLEKSCLWSVSLFFSLGYLFLYSGKIMDILDECKQKVNNSFVGKVEEAAAPLMCVCANSSLHFVLKLCINLEQ